MIRTRLLALCVLLVGCAGTPTDAGTDGPSFGKAPPPPPTEAAAQILESPAAASFVNGASPTGTLTGRVTTACGVFGPAFWDRAGRLTTLPTVAGTCGGIGQAVNGSGVVVGTAYNGTQAAGAVRWTPATEGYIAERLPVLPNGKDAGPWGVNEDGWISSGNAAAVYTPSDGWHVFTVPAGTTGCAFTKIGNSGQAVSSCTIAGVTQGVFWETLDAAPVVLPLPPRGVRGFPNGINTGGAIAGFVTAADVSYRAVRWTRSGTEWTVQTLPDLGKGAGAQAINDDGDVAGSVYAGRNGSVQPAYWDANGALHLLDPQRGGEASAISNRSGGLVVGGYVIVSTKLGKQAARWLP